MLLGFYTSMQVWGHWHLPPLHLRLGLPRWGPAGQQAGLGGLLHDLLDADGPGAGEVCLHCADG